MKWLICKRVDLSNMYWHQSMEGRNSRHSRVFGSRRSGHWVDPPDQQILTRSGSHLHRPCQLLWIRSTQGLYNHTMFQSRSYNSCGTITAASVWDSPQENNTASQLTAQFRWMWFKWQKWNACTQRQHLAWANHWFKPSWMIWQSHHGWRLSQPLPDPLSWGRGA